MISTNYEKFYIKGEKSGANTITLSSYYLINVEIEEKTSNLNGNVSYDVVGNGTKNVDITFTYSDLYINGETYNAIVTASDGIDTLIIPVIINCSDTLIYTDVEDGVTIFNDIHIGCTSLPEVKHATIINDAGDSYTFFVTGNNVELSRNDITSKIKEPYRYLQLDNGLSKISYELFDGIYEFYLLDGFDVISTSMAAGIVKFKVKSTVNNSPVSPTVDTELENSIFHLGDGVYEITCNIEKNENGIEREFTITVIQPKTTSFITVRIVQRGKSRLVYFGDTGKLYQPSNYNYEYRIVDATLNGESFNVMDESQANYTFSSDTPQTWVFEFDLNTYFAEYMFRDCDKLTEINYLDATDVKWVHNMFSGCTSLQTIGKIIAPNATSTSWMFANCDNLKQIGYIDFSSDEDSMSEEFWEHPTLQHIGTFISSTPWAGRAFAKCPELETVGEIILPSATDIKYMLAYNKKLRSVGKIIAPSATGGGWIDVLNDTPELETVGELVFSGGVDATGILSGHSKLVSIGKVDLSNSTSVYHAFYNCRNLQYVDELILNNAYDMRYLFTGCYSLVSINKMDTTGVRGDMDYAFYKCSNLRSLPILDVTDMGMSNAFYGCSSLTDLGGFVGCRWHLDLSDSPLLTHESLMNVINNLASMSPGGAWYLTLGEVNLTKLTDDEIKIATDKGWRVI